MKVEEALRLFMDCHKEILEALTILRVTAKEEGSEIIQEYIKKEDFAAATKIIKELDNFTKIDFESNIERIIHSCKTIFDATSTEVIQNKRLAEEKTTIATPNPILLNDEEKEILETIGLTGISRIEDAPKQMHQKTIDSLEEKGYLQTEEINWGMDRKQIFQLSKKGESLFKELFGREAIDPFTVEIEQKYGEIGKGLFLYDVESSLQERNFSIEALSGEDIEISKDNKHYYMTSLYQNIEEKDYLAILEKKNTFKNIGFICADRKSMDKAKEMTEKWTKNNQSRSRFLSVHMATVDDIKNSPQIFETLSY